MVSIREAAENYSTGVKTVAELESFDIETPIMFDESAQFPYYYIFVNNERYKVPKTVLQSIKDILETEPNIKKVRVKASGSGKTVKYNTYPVVQ